MRLIKSILAVALVVVLLLVGILLTVNNQQQVAIDLVFFQSPTKSVALWLVFSFLLGALFSFALALLSIMALKTRLQAARRRIDHSQKELDKLRTLNLDNG